MLVLAVANQKNEGKVKYAYTAGKPYAIFDEDVTLTMIAAGHSDEGALTSTYISEVTGVKGQILDLTEVEDFKAIGLQMATADQLFEFFYESHPDLMFILEIKNEGEEGKKACKLFYDMLKERFPNYLDQIVVGTFKDENGSVISTDIYH